MKRHQVVLSFCYLHAWDFIGRRLFKITLRKNVNPCIALVIFLYTFIPLKNVHQLVTNVKKEHPNTRANERRVTIIITLKLKKRVTQTNMQLMPDRGQLNKENTAGRILVLVELRECKPFRDLLRKTYVRYKSRVKLLRYSYPSFLFYWVSKCWTKTISVLF